MNLLETQHQVVQVAVQFFSTIPYLQVDLLDWDA
jgi:hypothetical protein